MMTYGMSKEVSLSYDAAIEKLAEELKKEGFGILTSIDVKETLKKKLDVDVQKYIILGACNPPFAYRALQAEEQIGLLLPCNVIVYEKAGKTIVGVFDPMSMMALLDNAAIKPIAEEITLRLSRVLQAIN
ncbi:MAG TPA: DUF302 domain-containing protein [Bacteroidota bacterium]|nr:DUF302 domain-containing protein [Bacteroidota bacterium]